MVAQHRRGGDWPREGRFASGWLPLNPYSTLFSESNCTLFDRLYRALYNSWRGEKTLQLKCLHVLMSLLQSVRWLRFICDQILFLPETADV